MNHEATMSTPSLRIDEIPTDLFIGGAWRASGSGKRIDVFDPATEERLASVADATTEDAILAVDAAAKAAPGWAATAPRKRSEILRRCFELITRDAEQLAQLITMENGKALADARGEVAYAAEFFRWFAEEAVRSRLPQRAKQTGRIIFKADKS
jgi:succinate-semialdehyde dehydrogenase/glutarate-semialdehyde dehydrogenase